MLNDYIASLPIDVIRKVEVDEEKIVIPIKVDSGEFYKKHKENIEKTDELTPEKAIYLTSISEAKPRKSISQLLIRGR